MVHVIDTAYQTPDRLYSYTLGMRTLKRTRQVYQSQEVVEELLDARWGGRLLIPEQQGTKRNPDNIRDDDPVEGAYSRLDPATWIEEMAGGLNTSEFGLFHPTIETDASNYYSVQGNLALENNHLKLSVATTGSPTQAARGLFVKLAGTSPRIYKIVRVNGSMWFLVPGRLPWSDVTGIEAADTMRFRLLNPDQIEEYLDYSVRGPYSFDWLEAR